MNNNDTKTEQMIRAAWMYYVLGKNQNDIAETLGISRPVVQRLIAAAKDEGAITMTVHHPIATCLDYAKLISEKFNLKECHVVPTNSNEQAIESIAYGGGQILTKFIHQHPVHAIGIGSGNTLKQSVNHLQASARPQIRCISLISAIGSNGQCNYYDDVPLLLASKIKANYYQLATPRYAKNADDLRAWQQHDLYQQLTHYADQCDVIFTGIGNLGENSPIYHDGFISSEVNRELIDQGCVGEILGHFIDTEGHLMKHPLNHRITSYDIRNNPHHRIAIAGGINKQRPLLGAIKGQWINGLVTDEVTAKWLLVQ